MDIDLFVDYKQRVLDNVSKVIVGKDEVITLLLICFICSGHALIEDLPGTGKTMLLRAFAKTIGGDFKRIQFTPDLLPADLTGINFYNQKSGEFQFRPGPMFTNLVLADEINRATPRTQSSLLEAMEERQITIDGDTFLLQEPFMVMATQNPIESYGTFPLPEAQIDRFFMRLTLGFMKRHEEITVLSRGSVIDIVTSLEQRVTASETALLKEGVGAIKVHPDVLNYIMDIIEATRVESRFMMGVSTRGAIALYRAAQCKAAFSGRDYVIPEDVREVAPHILRHRLSMGLTVRADRLNALLQSLIDKPHVPIEDI